MTTLSREGDGCQYSVILGGRVGVGKTALFHRILYDCIPEEPRSPTGQYENGLERGVYCMKIKGEEVKVSLWDTGGLERYTAMTANYFRKCHAVILVYSLEEEDTLFALGEWLSEARSLSCNQLRVVPALWGNKSESDNTCAMEEMASAFSTENKIPPELVARVSAHTGEGVKKAFEEVICRVHSQFGGVDQETQQRTLEPLIDPHLTQKTRPCSSC